MLKNSENAVFRECLRRDFYSFLMKCFLTCEGESLQHNWHLEVICDKVIRCCVAKEMQRLIITSAPRSLKSFILSVALPAWLMGHNPRQKIITVSYSQELAAKFARQHRMIMQQPWYREVFPAAKLNPRKSSEIEFETAKGGYRLSTSVNGTLTGRGADLIIIDDPIKPQDAMSDITRKKCNEWVGNTLISRLNNKRNGIVILVMQRVHVDDMAGYLMEKGGWDILNLPAISPDEQGFYLKSGKCLLWEKDEPLNLRREPHHILEQLKNEMGEYAYNAQYLQSPVPFEGNLIKRKWFKEYNGAPLSGGMFIQSWDIATTCNDSSDFSACTTFVKGHDGKYYIWDSYQDKLEFPELKEKIKEMGQAFGPVRAILIEESPVSLPLIQQLRREGFTVIAVRPQGSKKERLLTASLAVQAGKVLFPSRAEPWKDELQAQLLAFPGRHDDLVDSFTQFINWAESKYGSGARSIPI